MAGSVLETFLIVFGIDDAPLRKGVDSAKKSTDQAANSLNSMSENITKKVNKSLKDMAKELAGVFVGALAVKSVISNINAAANYASSLDKISDSLGLNIESLDAWGNAVRKSGGTAESFFETAKNLTTEISKFSVTGGSTIAPFFQILGVRLLDTNGKARDLFKILPELADAFQRVGRGRALELGKSIGLDQATILMLQQGGKEVDALIKRQKELGVVTKRDAEIASKFNLAWEDTAHAFRSLYTSIGSAVLPAVTSIVTAFEKVVRFVKDNEHFIKGVLIAIGTVISVYIVPALFRAAAAALVLYAPFILIAAIIAAIGLAFALAYDDVMNFLAGNDSVIGEIVKKWPWVKDLIYGIIKAFKIMKAVVGEVFSFLVDAVAEAFAKVAKFFSVIKDVLSAVKGFLGSDAASASLEVKGGEDDQLLSKAKNMLYSARHNPLAAQTSNSISNASNSNATTTSNSVSTGPITIQTQATDAEGIAADFTKSLQYQIRQAGSSLDDGVAA